MGTGGEDVENLKVRLLWDLDPELSQVVVGVERLTYVPGTTIEKGTLFPLRLVTLTSMTLSS